MTEPSELLDRDLSKSGAQQVIDLCCPVLEEVINYGTHVFDRCQRAAKGEADEHLPVLLSYMHILEMADAVDVLLRASVVHPAEPLVRSMFEAVCGIEYILKADSKRRAFAWMVTYTRRRLAGYRALSPNTAAGKRLREEMAKDEALFKNAVPPQELGRAIENLERLLQNKSYSEADKEYERQTKSRPEWYSLYGGPSNLRQLSADLGKLGQYEFLYRKWSTIAHASDISRWITRSNGEPAFFVLRNPKELLTVANFAIIFALSGTRTIVQRFVPTRAERLTKWYVQEVRRPWHRIRETKVNIVEKESRRGNR